MRYEGEPAADPDGDGHGRYVLHRHTDEGGPHLDLRIELPEGTLAGWRLPVDALDRAGASGDVLCSVKAEHPARWLDHDSADCTVADAGRYSQVQEKDGSVRLAFTGGVLNGLYEFRRRSDENVLVALVEVTERFAGGTASIEDVERLAAAAEDGRTARTRAVERLCGLGRELDGDAFDEPLWRSMLAPLSLNEIHRQIARFERRYDEKYPPVHVTRASETVEDEKRKEEVAAILSELA
jgi:hypothetical protein